MNPLIEQLLLVQEVDSELILLSESLRLRPRELDDDRKSVVETRRSIDGIAAQIKRLKMAGDRREVDVRKSDADIEKYKIALNQAKTNQEYTIFKEQIRREEELRGKAEEEVLQTLAEIDAAEAERKALTAKVAEEDKALKRREAEVEGVLAGIRKHLEGLKAKRADLVEGIPRENLQIYERVLARLNNFAIARVEDQICQGCFMMVTNQDVNLIMQGQFVQCKSCARLLFLP
jgi:predicted  nucleic acid-binding Zn-ribbon protein